LFNRWPLTSTGMWTSPPPINLGGTFYYLCSLLDGCSRAIVHHELRQSMTLNTAVEKWLAVHGG
jgi:tRNA A37 N6-isopentenylltransferase MiaA